MSAFGPSGHPSGTRLVSAFGGKADSDVRLWPKADIKALERGDDIIFKQTPIIDRFGFRFHHSTLFRRTA